MELFILLFAMLLGMIPAAIAHKKGHSFVIWWALGTLLFIIALPLAIIASEAEPPGLNPGMTRCAYCGHQMKKKLSDCPTCRRAQPEINGATQASWERIVSGNDEVEQWAKQNAPK